MRRIEIKASSLEEAKLIALEEYGVTVIHDAYPSWKVHGKPLFPKEMGIWAADFMERNKMFAFENAGIIVPIKNAGKDTRRWKAEFINYVRKGRAKLTRSIEIRAKSDDRLVGRAKTKGEAIKLARKLIKEEREDLYAVTKYLANDIDFELRYPLRQRRITGQYIVYAVDEGDVKAQIRQLRAFQ